MRIGVDARALGVPTFGIGRYTRALLDRMTGTSGHEWFLYADGPLELESRGRVTVRDFPRRRPALSLPRSQLAFARWAATDRLDVFWSPRHHLPLMLPASIRCVLTIHDLTWRVCPGTMRWSGRMIERLLMPPSVGRADAIVCVSESTFDELGAWHASAAAKATVITEGCERPAGSLSSPHGEPYFLFVGTHEPRKNLARLVEAFAIARAEGLGDCRLVLAGRAGWGAPVEQVISTHGLGDVVDVPGQLSEEELHERLAGAVALCLPSLYEGFGLPALEAMQYGTPVIGSNVGAIPEVVGEGGLLIAPASAREMADAMLKLATDEALRSALSAKARDQAALFSWDTAAARTLAVLEGAAGCRQA